MFSQPSIKKARLLAELVWHEISAHALNSLVAVALGMLFVWLLPGSQQSAGHCCHDVASDSLFDMFDGLSFHAMHYSHTFFASITATMVAMRFSANNLIKSILVGIFVPPVFCTISDILVPYWGGKMLGIEMYLHLCVLKNFVPVLALIFFGVILGLLGSSSNNLATTIKLSAGSHFVHDFVSAAASLAYLVNFGYHDWTGNLVYVYLLMLIAVVIPCMLSDFIVPILICAPQQLPIDDDQHRGCAYSFVNNQCDAKKADCSNGRNTIK